jgi:hypothetical protein
LNVKRKTENGAESPLSVFCFTLFFFIGVTAACSARSTTPAPASAPAATGWFTDKSKETGLDFVHFNGMSGEFYYPEVMPPVIWPDGRREEWKSVPIDRYATLKEGDAH